MNTPWILHEYSANIPWIPLSLDPYGRSIPCKYHQAPYIPFHLSVFRFVSFVPFAVAITRGGIWFPNNFGSAKCLLFYLPCRGTMLVPRDCCLCCRPHSPFFRFHFSVSPEKSPQLALFLAHLANFLYLCTRFLRWREICPTKSVSQRSSWVGFWHIEIIVWATLWRDKK